MRCKSTLWILVLLAGVLYSPSLRAQTKVGVVDFQQALLDTGEMKKQAAILEEKYRPRQEEMERLSAELQEIQKKLQTATGSEGSQLQNEGTRKQREVQRLNEDLQADVNYDREGILGVGREKMQVVVAKLAEERGLDLVIDVRSSYFFKPTMDLTREATAAFDQAHPVSQ